MRCLALAALAFVLAACTGPAARGEMRYYTCEDGSGFNAELLGRTIKLHTATGVIELPRSRSDEPGTLYSNGLRSVIINEDGSARHAIGRRAWVACTSG